MLNKTERHKEQILRMRGVNPLKCMRCGKCSATCPAYDEMEYHPHEFVAMVEKGEITSNEAKQHPQHNLSFWNLPLGPP